MKPKFKIVFYHDVAWFQPIDLRAVAWMEAEGRYFISWVRLQGFCYRLAGARSVSQILKSEFLES